MAAKIKQVADMSHPRFANSANGSSAHFANTSATIVAKESGQPITPVTSLNRLAATVASRNSARGAPRVGAANTRKTSASATGEIALGKLVSRSRINNSLLQPMTRSTRNPAAPARTPTHIASRNTDIRRDKPEVVFRAAAKEHTVATTMSSAKTPNVRDASGSAKPRPKAKLVSPKRPNHKATDTIRAAWNDQITISTRVGCGA